MTIKPEYHGGRFSEFIVCLAGKEHFSCSHQILHLPPEGAVTPIES